MSHADLPDAGIASHFQIDAHLVDPSAHHARYTNAEAEAVADAQIATHAADDDAHHARYTDVEAEAVADTQIATHAADYDAHAIYADRIEGETRTLLPTGTIAIAITVLYVVTALSAGTTQGGAVMVEVSKSQVILEDGSDTCTLAVTGTGALTVIAAGSDAYDIKLLPVWL